MKLRAFDEELPGLGLRLGSTEAEASAMLETRKKEKAAAEAKALAEADSDIASVYLENRILKACRNGDVATGMDTLKDMLQTGAAVAPSQRVISNTYLIVYVWLVLCVSDNTICKRRR